MGRARLSPQVVRGRNHLCRDRTGRRHRHPDSARAHGRSRRKRWHLVQPHLLKTYGNSKIERFPLSDEAVDKVTQGLFGVVNEGGGTAYHLRLANIDLCGKSGTAQLMGYDAASRLGTKKMDGWFVGFAPRRNPEIVVAAIVQDTVEHGGEAAGPVVRDIVKMFYDKKNAHTQQTATTEAPAQPTVSRPLVATVGVQHP